ncbi:MAG: diguanylate cyclase [Sphaerochaeta sp.]
MKRKTWIFSTSLVLLSTLLLVLFSLGTLTRIERIYRGQTFESIEELKRQFLYDTVNNQIKRIDTQRQIIQEEYGKQLEHITWQMNTAYTNHVTEFPEIVSSFFCEEDSLGWTAILWQRDTGNVLVDNKNLVPSGAPPIDIINKMLPDYQLYELHSFAPYTLFVGYPQAKVDEEVKEYIAQEIYDSQYSENSYIWVNEVVNYEGGDDYAIRRIHPNLRDTVGQYLSTSMTDVQGTTPYLTELEGVKQNGELFFSYYFKKKDSDVISEKLTYAKLYKDFDWIVAMGIHLDDLAMYAGDTSDKSASIVGQITPIFIGAIIMLFILHSAILVLLEHQKNKQQAKALEDQVYKDPLTGIGNRRSGLLALKKAFLESRKEKDAAIVVVFDIDYFKHINDTYGHDAGDRCLIQLTSILQAVICQEDAIYRWGGDEFLIICPHEKREEIERRANDLLRAARSVKVEHETITITLTISLGITSFVTHDLSEKDVLKRADKALYQAKEAGRDRFVLLV